MNRSRIVRGLYHAERLAERPSFIPKGRPRGAAAAGLRYERAFGKALGGLACRGQWFKYKDSAGDGWCEVDYLIEMATMVAILECKYTWTPAAYAQTELLYRPVVEFALKKQVLTVQVCKRLMPEASEKTKITGNLGNALILARSGSLVTLHWLENTPVMLRVSDEQRAVMEMTHGREAA